MKWLRIIGIAPRLALALAAWVTGAPILAIFAPQVLLTHWRYWLLGDLKYVLSGRRR